MSAGGPILRRKKSLLHRFMRQSYLALADHDGGGDERRRGGDASSDDGVAKHD